MNPEQLAAAGSEHAHQRALFAWANMAMEMGYAAAWDMLSYSSKEYASTVVMPDKSSMKLMTMFAIPNGGERNKAVAAKLKAEGVKPGVPDIFLPVAVGRWYGLFVEMKKIGGKASPEQKDWIGALTCNGYRVYLCEGWRMAAESIQYYLEGHDTYIGS